MRLLTAILLRLLSPGPSWGKWSGVSNPLQYPARGRAWVSNVASMPQATRSSSGLPGTSPQNFNHFSCIILQLSWLLKTQSSNFFFTVIYF